MFNENYIIKGKIVCETGLHIGGSNDSLDIGGSDSMIIRDSATERPYIPGSSLKGKLRSLFELNEQKSIDSILGDAKGGPSVDEESLAVKIFGISADKANKIKYPTRLIVRDSYPNEEDNKFWDEHEEIIKGTELKYENTIDRIKSSANLRNIERVPKGSVFDFEMIFSRYDDEENNLRYLFEAMEYLEDNYLGGSGSRGYGKVRFKDISVVIRGQDYYKEDAKEKEIVLNAESVKSAKINFLEETKEYWEQMF